MEDKPKQVFTYCEICGRPKMRFSPEKEIRCFQCDPKPASDIHVKFGNYIIIEEELKNYTKITMSKIEDGPNDDE